MGKTGKNDGPLVQANLIVKLLPSIPKDVAQGMSDFLGRVFGGLAEGGELLADHIRFFRYQSAIKTLQRAKEIAEEAKAPLKQVPIKFLVPFLENCSLEEEDSELIERWARLLVSASAEYDPKHPTFADILSQISALEAILLKNMFERQTKKGFDKFSILLELYRHNEPAMWGGGQSISFDHAVDAGFFVMAGSSSPGVRGGIVPKNADQNIQSMLILERQNLIKIRTSSETHTSPHRNRYLVEAVLTPLGYDFVRACEGVEYARVE